MLPVAHKPSDRDVLYRGISMKMVLTYQDTAPNTEYQISHIIIHNMLPEFFGLFMG